MTVIHPKIEPMESRSSSSSSSSASASASGIGVQTFAAHSHINEHKVELKEPLIKSTAHFFDNSITVDPNDSFVRATPSMYYIFLIYLVYFNYYIHPYLFILFSFSFLLKNK